MTISLVAVFIPVLFMGGIVGRLLHEFSVTIAVAILISGFVSLSLTPMLGSRFLRMAHRSAPRLRLPRAGKRLRWRWRAVYDSTLKVCCASGSPRYGRRRADAGGHGLSVHHHADGFIPSQDSGFIFGVAMAGQDISFDSMARHQSRHRGDRARGAERRSTWARS